MALIVSLETSTDICSVAIHEENKLLATVEVHIPQSHASKLAVLVDQVLQLADTKADQLKAVAISSGPGSYTGLRIGMSTAKGLCYALKIPLIAVNSLELMAFQVKDFNFKKNYLCPMIDAMRMEVYCMLLDADGNTISSTEAKVIDASSFSEVLNNQEILFFGNGSLKCKSVIDHANAQFVDGIYPKSSYLGRIAFDHYRNEKFVDVIDFEPAYLKEFVAKKAKSVFDR